MARLPSMFASSRVALSESASRPDAVERADVNAAVMAVQLEVKPSS